MGLAPQAEFEPATLRLIKGPQPISRRTVTTRRPDGKAASYVIASTKLRPFGCFVLLIEVAFVGVAAAKNALVDLPAATRASHGVTHSAVLSVDFHSNGLAHRGA